MRRGILISCFVIGAALAGALMVAMRAAPEDDPLRPAAAAVVAADKQVMTDTTSQQMQQWSEASLARPLFSPDRRPSAAANAAAAPTAVLPRLSGIMITSAGSRAIFAAVGAGKPEVVVEGSSVGGYLVQSIANGEVVLIGPDGRHSLRPSFDAAAAPPAPFVPPAAAEPQAAKEASP